MKKILWTSSGFEGELNSQIQRLNMILDDLRTMRDAEEPGGELTSIIDFYDTIDDSIEEIKDMIEKAEETKGKITSQYNGLEIGKD